MPPDETQPQTTFYVESEACAQPQKTVTVHTLESDACGNVGQSDLQVLAAWTDGTWWIDNDGSLVGWTDWPPPGLLP